MMIKMMITGMLLAALATFVTPLNAENEKPGEELTVRVMTYNALHGGTKRGQPLSQSAKSSRINRGNIIDDQENITYNHVNS